MTRTVFILALVVEVASWEPLVAQETGQESAIWHVDLSFSGGTLTPTGDLGSGRNATGDGEALAARLKSGLFLGARVGVHGPRLGVEGGVYRSEEQIQVSNASEVFPFHSEHLTWSRWELLLYPWSGGMGGGLFRPFVSVGGGLAFSSVDLDNLNDQTSFTRPLISFGGGGRFRLGGAGSPVYVEAATKYDRVFGAELGPSAQVINNFGLWQVFVALSAQLPLSKS